MPQYLETGDENEGQVIAVPVPGRSSPLVVRAVPVVPPPPSTPSQLGVFGGTVGFVPRFLVPWDTVSGAALPTADRVWCFTPDARTSVQLTVALSVVLAADADLTFFMGAVPTVLGAAFNMILPAGNLFTTLLIPAVIPANSYFAIQYDGPTIASPNNIAVYATLF